MFQKFATFTLSACLALMGTSIAAANPTNDTGEPVGTYAYGPKDPIWEGVEGVTVPSGTIEPRAQLGWSWGGPTIFLNKAETRKARSTGDWGALCALMGTGWGIVCGLNVAAIVRGANEAHNAGKCLLLRGPTLSLPAIYTGKECF